MRISELIDALEQTRQRWPRLSVEGCLIHNGKLIPLNRSTVDRTLELISKPGKPYEKGGES